MWCDYGRCGGIDDGATGKWRANLGHAYPLMSIAACVIGGVSIFGGIGRAKRRFRGNFYHSCPEWNALYEDRFLYPPNRYWSAVSSRDRGG